MTKSGKKSPKELHYVFSEEASSYPCVSRVVKSYHEY